MTDDIGIEALPEEDAPAIELEVEVQDSVSVKDAEAWAVGQRGGVDVVEGDPTYHNNAKYYAGQGEYHAEAWAVGERGGVPVESGDPTYHNNAKWYAQAAEDAAASASAAYGTDLLAPTFDQATAYPAGQHVIHEGGYYVLPEGHTAGDTWAATSKTQVTVGGEVTGLKSAKADKDGTYEDLTAGNAEYLLSDRGDTDVAPYVFRKTGGAKKAYGRELLKKIVGGTVAWNQIVKDDLVSKTENGVTFTVDNTNHTITVSTGSGGATANTILLLTLIHVGWLKNDIVFVSGIPAGASNLTYGILYQHNAGGSGGGFYKENQVEKIASNYNFVYAYIRVSSGAVITTPVIFKPQIHNLTRMFGSTIADAIYAMEQATAGSGVAWFRSLFPNDYYAYDAGSLQSVQAKEHRLEGTNLVYKVIGSKNIWTNGTIQGTGDPYQMNVAKIRKGQQYIVSTDDPGLVCGFFTSEPSNNSQAYDEQRHVYNSNFTFVAPIDGWIAFRSYDGYKYPQMQIGSVVSAYEPYEAPHVYPLDSSLTLRGIPKWDSTNGLYYDGDEYEADGDVTRKYGIVDLGSLTFTASLAVEHVFYTDLSNSAYQIDNMICPQYIVVPHTTTNNDMPNMSMHGHGNNDYHRIYFKNSSYSDASAFKTAMSGIYLVYELATPTTESADAFRELEICNGNGTEEFVDAGVTATTPTRDVSIPVGTETFYPIDVVAYIEELTNPDHDMVADALIPSGKYFMVGNSLYKSTSQIQAGATIIPGSNCTAKNLAEALNELNT